MAKFEPKGSKIRIGLFGGTFDPIHLGHLLVAQEVLEKLKLDRIIFVPAYRAPHKKRKFITPYIHRIKMVNLAIKNNPNFCLSDCEIKRGGVSYTYLTLEYFQKIYPNGLLYLLMGLDQYNEIFTWKYPERIVKCAKIAVIGRNQKRPKIPEVYSRVLKRRIGLKTLFVNTSEIEIAASEIRERVKKKKTIENLVVPDVWRYILKKNVYR